MADVRWAQLSERDGIYAAMSGECPTGATALVDRSRPIHERRKLLEQEVTTLGRYGWLPDSVLAASMDNLRPRLRLGQNYRSPCPTDISPHPSGVHWQH